MKKVMVLVVVAMMVSSVAFAVSSVNEQVVQNMVLQLYKNAINTGISVSQDCTRDQTTAQKLLNENLPYRQYLSETEISNLTTMAAMYPNGSTMGDAFRDFAYSACPVLNPEND